MCCDVGAQGTLSVMIYKGVSWGMTSLVTRPAATLTVAAVGLVLTSASVLAQTELHIVVARYDSDTAQVFGDIAAGFETENPSIDVQVEVVEWDNLYQTLTRGISEGTPPDIAVVGTRWLVDFVSEGVIEPLDGYLTPQIRDRFVPSLFAPAEIGGQTWALPVVASTRAMYFNRGLLDRAGVTVPATWQELETVAAAVSALGDGMFGFGLQGSEIETDVYFYYALWSYGGALIESDGTSGLDQEQAIAAAAMYRRFIDEGLTQPGVTTFNRQDVQDLFKAGQLGMVVSGPWLARQLAVVAPELNFGIAPIPAETTAATYGVTDSIVMFASSPAKDQAWAFLDYMFQPEIWQAFSGREGYLPTTISAATGGEIGDANLAFYAGLLPDAQFTPTIANWEEIADITSAALQRIYLGEDTPRDALTAAAVKIDAILAQ